MLARIPWGVSAKYNNSWTDTEHSLQQREERVAKNPGFRYFVGINYIDTSAHLPLGTQPLCDCGLSHPSLFLQCLTTSASF